MGEPTVSPIEALTGMVTNFEGGYKGSSIAMLCEIFGGVLTSSGYLDVNKDEPADGSTIIALSTDVFHPRETYMERINDFVDRLK